MLLESINNPNDLKKLPAEQLPLLAEEIRQFLLETVSSTGGHLGSNLGTVELGIALHYCFDSPKDKIVWDVGHRPTPIRSSPAGVNGSTPSASTKVSPVFPSAANPSTTPSGSAMPRPPSRPHWVWRWLAIWAAHEITPSR